MREELKKEDRKIEKKDEKKEPVQGGKILGMFPEEAVPNWAMGLMATFFMFIVGFIMLVQFGGFQPMQTSWMDGYSKMQEAKVFKVKEMTKIDIEERRAKIEMLKNTNSTSCIDGLSAAVDNNTKKLDSLSAVITKNNSALKRHNIRLRKLEKDNR